MTGGGANYWIDVAVDDGSSGTDATATPAVFAVTGVYPAATAVAGSISGPRTATAAADLGGGTGSWANTSNATGTDDATYARGRCLE